MKFNYSNLGRVTCALVLAGSVLAPNSVQAVLTSVGLDSGSFTLTQRPQDGGTALTAGVESVNGDGAAIQLGYYSLATSADNFAGVWIPLTGKGGANSTYNTTSIGDFVSFTSPPRAGTFAMNLSFDSTNGGTGNALPATGTPLAIRIYSGTDPSSSSFFNAVSNDDPAWTWKSGFPVAGQVFMSLDDLGLEWQSGAPGAFMTTIAAAPEPSRFLLLGFGLMGLVLRRRRK